MRYKVILLSLILLPALCLAQQKTGSIQLYDNFNGTWIDPVKWAAVPTCSATQFLDTAASINLFDCVREIQSGQLHLMVKGYGHIDSDTDRQFGPSELYFANPNAINTISATVRIAHSASVSCPSNPTDSFGQALIGGNFFNTGTGDPKDDVAIAYFIQRVATAPKGTIQAGAVLFSPNAFYGYVDLGIHNITDVINAAVSWDQVNHKFSFRLAHSRDIRAMELPYSVSDVMPPVAPMKLLAARAFVPNCTTQLTSADMDVFFDDVYTKK
jgi:hypothetical protein